MNGHTYSPPSTPSWAKDGVSRPVSGHQPMPRSTVADSNYVYPDELYKNTPLPSPVPSWGLRSYQAQSALPPSDIESEYVKFDPIPESHVFTDFNRAYPSAPFNLVSKGDTVAAVYTQSPLPKYGGPGGSPYYTHGSLLEIPEIPLKVHEDSDLLLREKPLEPLNGEDIYLQSGKGLPYSVIYGLKRSIVDPGSPGFIPGALVDVSVIDVLNTDLLGRPSKQYTYAVKVSNGEHSWILRKTFSDWRNLHMALRDLQKKMAVKFSASDCAINGDTGRSGLPHFPTTGKENISTADLPGRMHGFTTYLQYLVGNSTCRDHFAVRCFLELSALSLVYGLGSKMKEGYVMQRVCDVPLKPFPVSMMCGNISDGAKWLERWLIVKETCIILIDPFDATVKDVVLADRTLQIDGGLRETGVPRGVTISSSTRRLILQCLTEKDVAEFVMEISFTKYVTARDFTTANEHGSFAPERNNCALKWLVDGKAYYKAVADALDSAKEDIFISGWWVSPELHLKRPVTGHYWRLDYILARKASQGVRIFVLLYRKNKLTDFLNSANAKKTLEDLYPGRIQVIICHPKQRTDSGNVLWANNEKVVLIDQSVAFIGGIDLCHGQWDNYEHRLFENISEKWTIRDSLEFDVTTGRDGLASKLCFSSPLTVLPSSSNTNLASSNSKRRKSSTVKGIPFTKSDHLYPQNKETTVTALTQAPPDSLENNSARVWLGKDYMNRPVSNWPAMKTSNGNTGSLNGNPNDAIATETAHLRLPWHDVGLMVLGCAATDIARHFIQRWNFSKTSTKENDHYRFLLPKVAREVRSLDGAECDKAFHSCTNTVLRSVGSWLGGLPTGMSENSIHTAIIGLIEKSQHYIYLETEVFISLASHNAQVSNGITQALVKRILQAHRSNQNFRVYVILPLMPAFEGPLGSSSGSVVQTVMHWQYESICRGQNSLVSQLAGYMPIQLISEYICFFGLRKFDYQNGKPVSEMIYNHSKTILVDDRRALIGSANMTDRSLSGNRDSEIACLITDEVFLDSVMDGRPFKSGKFTGSLRLRLMAEHLGCMETLTSKGHELFRDPVSEAFWKDRWLFTARCNTAIFEQVFSCTPSDEVRDFMELQFWEQRAKLAAVDPEKARRALADIQGHLVVFPLGFLRNAVLRPAIISKDGIMSAFLWT